MFAPGYFPPSYYPPSYWPKGGATPGGRGRAGAGAKVNYLALVWAEHQRSLLDAAAARRAADVVATERAVLDLYRAEMAHRLEQGMVAAAVETVLLAEL